MFRVPLHKSNAYTILEMSPKHNGDNGAKAQTFTDGGHVRPLSRQTCGE